MIWFARWRTLAIVEIVAFAAGLLIWWGGTDFSVFEGLVLLASIFTFIWGYKHRATVSVLDLLDIKTLILVGFAILVGLQFVFALNNIAVFAGTTLYLIGIYLLIRFWLRQQADLFTRFLFGYLLTALAISVLGIISYLLAITSIEWNILTYTLRWHGFMDDPVVYASLLVPAILVFGHLAVYTQSSYRYIIYVLAALICFSSLVLTGSRGAWLGLIVSALVLVFLDREFLHGRRFFLVLISSSFALVIFLALVYVVPFEGRTYNEATLSNRFEASDAPRISNAELAPQLVLDRSLPKFLFGSGSGSYEFFSPNGFSAHNTYLRVLFEQGVVGLVFFFTFLYLTIRAVWQNVSFNRRQSALLVSLIVGIMIHSLFVDTLHWRHFWLILALI